MNAPINGNSRRPTNYSRIPPMERSTSSQHDDLIKFIHESWNKISQEVGRNTATYYREQEPEMLKNFEPFDLEGYWGRKIIQNVQHQ